MFERYRQISAHFDADTLAHEWPGLVEREFAAPWERHGLTGHVPYSDFQLAFSVLAAAMNNSGLYVWGSGIGAEVRIHYVGIATKLFKRFDSRYVARSTGRNGKSASGREMGIAAQHEEALRRMPEDFRVHGTRSLAKFESAGIVVAKGRRTRLHRAERYAKAGLTRIWYALVPAPAETTKKRLELIETTLINASNAHMFRAFASHDAKAQPLLNLVKVEKENRWLSPAEQQGYSAWLRGGSPTPDR